MAQSTENQKIDLPVLQKQIDKMNESLVQLDKKGLRTFTFAKERVEMLKERTSKLKKEQQETAEAQQNLTDKLKDGTISTDAYSTQLNKLRAASSKQKKDLQDLQKEQGNYIDNLKKQETSELESLKKSHNAKESSYLEKLSYEHEESKIKQKYARQNLDAQLELGQITEKKHAEELARLDKEKKDSEDRLYNISLNYANKIQKQKEKIVEDALKKERDTLEQSYNAQINALAAGNSQLNKNSDAECEQFERNTLVMLGLQEERDKRLAEIDKKMTSEAIAETAKMYTTYYSEKELKESEKTQNDLKSKMDKLQQEQVLLEQEIEANEKAGLSIAETEEKLYQNRLKQAENFAEQNLEIVKQAALKQAEEVEKIVTDEFNKKTRPDWFTAYLDTLGKGLSDSIKKSDFPKTLGEALKAGINLAADKPEDASWKKNSDEAVAVLGKLLGAQSSKSNTAAAAGTTGAAAGSASTTGGSGTAGTPSTTGAAGATASSGSASGEGSTGTPDTPGWVGELGKYLKYVEAAKVATDALNSLFIKREKEKMDALKTSYDEKIKLLTAERDAELKTFQDARNERLEKINEDFQKKEDDLREEGRSREDYEAQMVVFATQRAASIANVEKVYKEESLLANEDFNNKKKEADEQLTKDQAELKLKAAKREKTMAIITATMNTALAIGNALTTTPFPVGLAMAIVAGALGAAQVAAIASQPIPKAARGGLIGGRSHALGGTLIEAEAGEAIINRRSTTAFAPLLSAINQLGGGVPFAATASDGGFAQREYSRQSQPSLSVDDMRTAMREAVSEVKIYTAIEDINDGSKRYTEITDTSVF